MFEHLETVVTGGFLGTVAVIAGRAVTYWLKAIYEQMKESNNKLVELTTMFAKFNTSNEIEHVEFRRQLLEHADLHKQHHATFRRLGVRDTGSAGSSDAAGSTP